MYPNTFYRVSVKALIQNANGKVLVVKENQDTWSLPGGGLDHGEKPVDGILRELNEELGIQNAEVGGVAQAKTFYLEDKQLWLMWLVFPVKINDYNFTRGDGVSAAAFLDASAYASSGDMFEKIVYETVNSKANQFNF